MVYHGSHTQSSEVSLLNQINLVIDVGMKHLNSLCPFPTIQWKYHPQLFISYVCGTYLPVFPCIFIVSFSWLHLIMPTPQLRLMGLIIVRVALMKEPLLNVTYDISEDSRVRFCVTVLLFKKRLLEYSCPDLPLDKSHFNRTAEY